MLTFLLKCSVYETSSACYTLYGVCVWGGNCNCSISNVFNQELDISNSIQFVCSTMLLEAQAAWLE
jgi:hypothetical protein